MQNLILYKSQKIKWAGHVACIGELRNTYKILIGKPERTTTLRSKRRWKFTKINLTQKSCVYVDCIHLARIGPVRD